MHIRRYWGVGKAWTGTIVNPYYKLLTGPPTTWLDSTVAPIVVGNGEDWLIWDQTTLLRAFRWIIVEGGDVDGFPLDLNILDVGSYDVPLLFPNPPPCSFSVLV